VSLLSPEHISMMIAPDRVQIIHVRGRGAPIVACTQTVLAASGVGDVTALVEVCGAMLDNFRNIDLRVVVADRLVRYLHLPWNAQLRNSEELQSFAAMLFDGIYGEQSASGWKLTFSAAPPGQGRLICALPLTLHAGLVKLSGERAIRLKSIKPNMCAIMELNRRALKPHGWFLNAEPGRLSMLQWGLSGCQWVGSARYEVVSSDAAIALVDRQSLVNGEPPLASAKRIPVYLTNPLQSLSAVEHIDGVNLTVLGLRAEALRKVRQSPAESVTESTVIPLYSGALMGAAL